MSTIEIHNIKNGETEKADDINPKKIVDNSNKKNLGAIVPYTLIKIDDSIIIIIKFKIPNIISFFIILYFILLLPINTH